MFSPFVSHLLLVAIVTLSLLLMLVRPRGIAEVWWVGTGASLLLALRLVPLRLAETALRGASDVCFFLIGMMLLSELARHYGVFDWVAAKAVLGARQKASRLFLLVYGIGTLVTICLSNDATAVVLTPAVLAAIRKADVQPRPHLFCCAMVANAASFVLPISNPANLVVFHDAMPGLGRWLAFFTLPSLLSVVVTWGVLRLYFRRPLADAITCRTEDVSLSADGRLVLVGLLAVVGVLLAASAAQFDLGWPTLLAATIITAIVSVRAKQSPIVLVRAISWSTLLLVAGLFVLVDAVETLGALHATGAALHWISTRPQALGTVLAGMAVGVGNNLVNNLPLGLLAGATLQATAVHGLLAHAVLVGVDLGPNLSVTGSLATILWLLSMRKEGLHVSAWEFLKVGVVAMPAALLAALAGLLLTHALLHL